VRARQVSTRQMSKFTTKPNKGGPYTKLGPVGNLRMLEKGKGRSRCFPPEGGDGADRTRGGMKRGVALSDWNKKAIL